VGVFTDVSVKETVRGSMPVVTSAV